MTERKQVQRDALSLHLVVLRCQVGDERAFAELFATFGERTLGYLRGLVGDDADDVQQEVWLTVYRSIASLANPGAFRTWLFQTTRHRALDYLRRRKRERELLDVASEVLVTDDAGDEGPALQSIDEGSLNRALMAIPPPQREVLLLRYRDDLSYNEIAVIVGIPLGTVRTRLHHAKRRLEELLTRGNT
jgi:RNA polymerase sigma-70 factor (ECF subfamily)